MAQGDASSQKRKRGRPSLKEQALRNAAVKRAALEVDFEDDDHRHAAGFPKLITREKRVPQNIISSKWKPLNEAAQQSVRMLLDAAERPVIVRYRNDKKRSEAQVALGPIARSLRRKLPRMPFPPKTSEAHFNFEALLDANRATEAQLTPTIHAISLLKSEIKKEQDLLEEEKVKLRRLEREVELEEAARDREIRSQNRPSSGTALEEPTDSLRLSSVKALGLGLLDPSKMDRDLSQSIEHLQNHLESIRSNTEPIRGIKEAAIRTRAAVEEVLYRRLPVAEYALMTES